MSLTRERPGSDRLFVGQVEASGSLSNLPRPPTNVFVGRDDDLAVLERLVAQGSGVVSQVVHGLGGVGKTELVLQYAHRYGSRHRLRWWITADQPGQIEAGLAGLTYRLQPDVRESLPEEAAAEWALAWLQDHTGWLLVPDNVEQRANVEVLLGQLTSGHVLITTRRNVGWEPLVAGCLRLGLLNPDEAVQLLLKRNGQTDAATAGQLAAELGFLPLALQQAGAFLAQTSTPMAAYLQRLREQPIGLLEEIAQGDDARRAVARVWQETLIAIRDTNPRALDLLRLLACYAPDNIPRTVLTAAGEDPADTNRALALLRSCAPALLRSCAPTA
jgi:NB-ARC domain